MPTAKTIKPVGRQPLLHVSVQESVRTYIEENDLRSGDPLPPESFLAQQLGVGRNSVREAIKALESLGILETRRGIGVFVKEFSFQPLLDNLAYGLGDNLRDLEELRIIRRVLETGLIEKTVEMITDEDIATLRDTARRMKLKAEKNEGFAKEDREFHQLLFRCQNNNMLSSLINIFWMAFHKAAASSNLANPDPMKTWSDHHNIVEAIAARDAARARKCLEEHYTGIQRVLAEKRSR